jgi:integrase
MSRIIRDTKLETRAARDRVTLGRKPHWKTLNPGKDAVHLGYRRKHADQPGTWLVRRYIGDKNYRVTPLGLADDFHDATEANGLLTFAEAQRRALAAKATDVEGRTLRQGLEAYDDDLKARGAGADNGKRARSIIDPPMLDKPIASLTTKDFSSLRLKAAKRMKRASVNRAMSNVKAMLNLAAASDARLDPRVWETGLKTFNDADEARNVILDDDRVRAIVEEAYVPRPIEKQLVKPELRTKDAEEAKRWAEAFGLLVEVLAETGTRVSQAARLDVQDAQGQRDDPRLMMPSSKKGKGVKKITHKPVPISPGLAQKLRRAAGKRAPSAPLLLKPTGERWAKSDHSRPFDRVLERLKAQLPETEWGDDVTIYALRHSSIVRQILAGTPIRVIASNHDTSVAMIERNYSRFISDHSDALARRGLIDLRVGPSPLCRAAQ